MSANAGAPGGDDLRFGDVAQKLVDGGYRPLPVVYGKKYPNFEGWPEYKFDSKHIRGALSVYGRCGTAILTGRVVAVDIDVRDPDLARQIEDLAESMLGPAPRRIGQAPKVMRLYQTAAPFAKITGIEVALDNDLPGAKKHKVEILGVGQQAVVYNLHPDTGKPYVWNGQGEPLSVPVSKLTPVTEAKAQEFVAECDVLLEMNARSERSTDSSAAAPAGNTGLPPDLEAELHSEAVKDAARFEGKDKLRATDPAECRSALAGIPNNDADYDFYVKIGHAICGALGFDGHADWHAWARRSTKYAAKRSEADWAGFMRLHSAGKLRSGAGTIIFEAKNAGWTPEDKTQPIHESLIERIPAEWLSTPPPPQQWLIDQLIPMGCVSAVLAEGGSGKSFAMLALAEATAHGAKHWWSSEDRALRQGGVVYIAAEDTADVIRRRLFAIRTRWVSRMAKSLQGKKLAAAIETRNASTLKRLHLAPIVGRDIHLIDTTTGEVKQGPGVERLIADLRQVDELALVILDPLSRLHGGDENSNAVSTALISAAERIAQEFGCATIIIHHVSKQSATDKNASAHSGRGGSALGDGARSVLRFLPCESKDIRSLKLLRQGVPITISDIAAGNVVRIVHAKNSYGPRAKDMFLLRDSDTGELLTLKVVADDRDPYATALASLGAWLASNPIVITKDTFRDCTTLRRKVFGAMSKNDWLETFETAVVKGDLIEDPTYRGKNSTAKGYRLADTRHTRQIPASDLAGIAIDGEEAVGGRIPATTPNTRGGGYILAGIPPSPETPKPPLRRPVRHTDTRQRPAGIPRGPK